MQQVYRLISQFTPHSYDLSVSLERQERTFSGVVSIRGETRGDSGTITLHSKDLVIESAHIDGSEATWELGDNDETTFTPKTTPLARGAHIITISFSGRITDAMHGLYPCYYKHEGAKKELLATQFESHHAREVFPCIDEPEAKATFDVTLTTEQNVTVLGNMPVKNQREEDNRLVTTFETTPRMSSYLLAWVVGELQKKTAMTASGVETNIWATPAQSPDSLDFALDIATRTIDFFDEYFGVTYPLPKADHVALPDFSSGAMENWGLITYRESALLAHPTQTDITRRRLIATVITHELSHQWFGNLVTMKWWDNLWLNESFANFMEYIAVDALEPEWNIWQDYAGYEPVLALRRDAIDGVQPVETEVHHPDEISTLFDGAIVYAKGGRLLRMLMEYIGTDAFQAGLRRYFKTYAYQNTTGDNLWDEFSAASGRDIRAFMNTWISQPGYPVVTVDHRQLSQRQFFIDATATSNRLWPIPLASSDTDAPRILETASSNITLPVGERLNVGSVSHFITRYSDDHMAALIDQARQQTLPAIDRLGLLHEQTLLARSGAISSAELLPLIQAYAAEATESVWDMVVLTLGELKKFVETDTEAEASLRALSAHIARQQYDRLGWEATKNEPESDTKLRSTILGMMLYSRDEAVIARAHSLYQNTPLDDLPAEIRDLVLTSEVVHFHTPSLIDTLLAVHADTASNDLQSDIVSALTSTRDEATIDRLLMLLTDTSVVRSQDTARWFVYLLRNRHARQAAWQWMQENWQWITATFAGDKSFDDFPRYAAAGLVTRHQLDEYKEFFTPLKRLPALTRTIDLGIKELSAKVDLLERDTEPVRVRLASLSLK